MNNSPRRKNIIFIGVIAFLSISVLGILLDIILGQKGQVAIPAVAVAFFVLAVFFLVEWIMRRRAEIEEEEFTDPPFMTPDEMPSERRFLRHVEPAEEEPAPQEDDWQNASFDDLPPEDDFIPEPPQPRGRFGGVFKKREQTGNISDFISENKAPFPAPVSDPAPETDPFDDDFESGDDFIEEAFDEMKHNGEDFLKPVMVIGEPQTAPSEPELQPAPETTGRFFNRSSEQVTPEQVTPEQATPEQVQPEQAQPEQVTSEQAQPEQITPIQAQPVQETQTEPVQPAAQPVFEAQPAPVYAAEPVVAPIPTVSAPAPAYVPVQTPVAAKSPASTMVVPAANGQTLESFYENMSDEDILYRDCVEVWAADTKPYILRMIKYIEGIEDKQTQALFGKECEYINAMLDRIYAFTQLEYIDEMLEPKKYVFSTLVKECLKRFSPFFMEKKIGLLWKGLDINIVVDKRWFIFALTQVLFNAVEFTGEGGKIAISAKRNGDYIDLVVDDSGKGISPDEMPYIFVAGYMGDDSPNENGRRTGMGLFIARSVLVKMGGDVYAESSIGKGTRITLHLPAGCEE